MLGASAGDIAEAFYGVPEDIEAGAMQRLDPRLRAVTINFRDHVGIANPR